MKTESEVNGMSAEDLIKLVEDLKEEREYLSSLITTARIRYRILTGKDLPKRD